LLRNYYINKEFIVSQTARRIYRSAASVSIGMFVLLVALKMAHGVPVELLPEIKALLFIGVMGTALNMTAMEYFLFAYDRSAIYTKVFWFCAMLFLPPFGAACYCFVVYSHSEEPSELPQSSNSASA
jgi:hypothetical protein